LRLAFDVASPKDYYEFFEDYFTRVPEGIDAFAADTRRLSDGRVAMWGKDSDISIPVDKWIMFANDELVEVKQLTIFGKLSFSDNATRELEADSIIVWGVMEIGTESRPFGATTGATVTIRLRGGVRETDDYVYIEEETLHNKAQK